MRYNASPRPVILSRDPHLAAPTGRSKDTGTASSHGFTPSVAVAESSLHWFV